MIPADPPPLRDTLPDTWAAVDALGRRLPDRAAAGAPRKDRTVGIFYFLWHGPHVNGGPWDISKILAQDPDAADKPDSPLWGPPLAPHHWGESRLGYYVSTDPFVLRKHAQMLADAGVDFVVFDVTNQFTYPDAWKALLTVWSDVRAKGGRTPQIAFLCPFWDPAKVVRELWDDLYGKNLHPDLWFRWEGKPLILADPGLLGRFSGSDAQNSPVPLKPGHTLAQRFTADTPFRAAGGRFPTWATTGAAFTLTLRRDDGTVLARRRCRDVGDNDWLFVGAGDTPYPPGAYTLEASDASGTVGWWSHTDDVLPGGAALADGTPAPGDRTLRLRLDDPDTDAQRRFFTFRTPQPSYFAGPRRPDMWSWLEVYPQHVFRDARGRAEQMSVGVAQNAADGEVSALSHPRSLGRSFHAGKTDTRPDAVRHGFNLAEQWARARKVDPRVVFVTGWNEWIAGRYSGTVDGKPRVWFVDQFDQEHSRDIEPMRGGHGDDYYWQLVAEVRRTKGVRPAPAVGPAVSIDLRGPFAQWAKAAPEYRDDVGDAIDRNTTGFNGAGPYVVRAARNDIVAAKVARDRRQVAFWVRCAAPIVGDGPTLLIDADADPKTGWEGCEWRVTGTTLYQHAGNGWSWKAVQTIPRRTAGTQSHLAIPRARLARPGEALRLRFQWSDQKGTPKEALDLLDHGDAAPNLRFRYVYDEPAPPAR